MKKLALTAIDELWEKGARMMIALNGADWADIVPTLALMERTAREARERLDADAEPAEHPEPLRQARVVFRMIEASTGMMVYAESFKDDGYARALDEWSSLSGRAVGMLPELRNYVETLPDDPPPLH